MPSAPVPQNPPNDTSAAAPASQAYGASLKNLKSSLALAGTNQQAQTMQAQQQLQQNQGSLQQHLVNSGLGNTTVAGTMAQAPLQTYNAQMAQINDNAVTQKMQGYNQLAGQRQQGGAQLSGLLASLQNQNAQNGMQQQQISNQYATPTIRYPAFGGV